MKHLVWIAALALTACGADGEPITPEARAPIAEQAQVLA